MDSKKFLCFLILLLLSAATDDQWTKLTPDPSDDVLASDNNDFPATVVRPYHQRRSLKLSDRAPLPGRGFAHTLDFPSPPATLSQEANALEVDGVASRYLLMSLRR